MAIMKIVNNSYSDYNSVANLLNYILSRKNGWVGDSGSNLLLLLDGFQIAEQMRKVSAFYGKDNRRLVRHIIISYSPYYENWVTAEQRFYNIYECMKMYFPGHQWIMGMHEKEGETHIHIVYNLTDIYTGVQLSEGQDFFEQLSYGFTCHGLMTNGKMKHLRYKVCYGEAYHER